MSQVIELGSAKVRHEESRSDRLPEPIDLEESGLEQSERVEQVTMAFLVALQRLTPPERAVLLLHEVLDFEHEEIARLLGIAAPASRKALERARCNLANERRMLLTSGEEHRRLLETFLRAVNGGDVQRIVQLLADDAVLVTDGGARGRTFQGVRNLSQPVPGPARIASFLVAISARIANVLQPEMRDLNGQPRSCSGPARKRSARFYSRSPMVASRASSSMATWTASGTLDRRRPSSRCSCRTRRHRDGQDPRSTAERFASGVVPRIAFNVPRSAGLTRWWSNPASRARSRSVSWPQPVNATRTGWRSV